MLLGILPGLLLILGGLDMFDASVNAKPGQLQQGFQAMWREVIRAKRFGFTSTELERAKASLLSSMTTAYKERDKTGSGDYVKEYQEFFLDGAAAAGIGAEYALTTRQLPGIILSEVNALLDADLKTTDRDILILGPAKDKGSLPDSSTVMGWMQTVEAESLEAYKDEVSTLPLLIHPPVAGKITGELYDSGLGVTTLTLRCRSLQHRGTAKIHGRQTGGCAALHRRTQPGHQWSCDAGGSGNGSSADLCLYHRAAGGHRCIPQYDRAVKGAVGQPVGRSSGRIRRLR